MPPFVARYCGRCVFTVTTLFVIYSALNGVTLSSIFLVYTMTSITEVFFISAGTFGAMALYGYVAKTNLAKIGNILFMALIGLVIASLVNMFLRSSGFDLILSYIGVLLSVGLTAWDSQRIKQALAMQPDMSEASQKIALLGALELYLDFINLFLYLLRIFGKNNN
jgi:FtsH-binding integral membrane protein